MSPSSVRAACAAAALLLALLASATRADDWGWTMQGSPVQVGGQLLVSEDGTRIDLMGGFDSISFGETDGIWSWSAPDGWKYRKLQPDSPLGRHAVAVDRARRRFICFAPVSQPGTQGEFWAADPSSATAWVHLGLAPFGVPAAVMLDLEDRLWAVGRTTNSSTGDLWWRSLADSGTWRRVGSLPIADMGLGWHFDSALSRHFFVRAPAGGSPSLISFPLTGGAPNVYPLPGLRPIDWNPTAFVDAERSRILVWSNGPDSEAGSGPRSVRIRVISLDTPGLAEEVIAEFADGAGAWPFANVGVGANGLWAVSADSLVEVRRASPDALGDWRLVADSGPSPPRRSFAYPIEPFVLEDSTSGWMLGQAIAFGVRDWSWLWRLDMAGGAVRWTPQRLLGSAPDSAEISASVYSPDERRVYAIGSRSVWAFDLEPTPHWSKLGHSGPGASPAAVAYDPRSQRLWVDTAAPTSWALEDPTWRSSGAPCMPDSSFDPYPRVAFDQRRERLIRCDWVGVHSNALTDTSCWRAELRTSGIDFTSTGGAVLGDSPSDQPYPGSLRPYRARTLMVDERRGELHLDGGYSSWLLAPIRYGDAVPLGSPVPGARGVAGFPIPQRNGQAVALTPACDRIVLAMGQRVWTWPAGGDELAWSIPARPAQEPDRVSLAWRTVNAFPMPVTLWRRTPAEAWQAIGTLAPDANGVISYEDPSATAGRRYGYRITRSDRLADLVSRDQWLTREIRAEFALHRAWPNPSSGRLTISFALARSGAVGFEVFDLSGRRVWRDAREVQAGQQLATLDLPASLRTGVYLLRVSSGGERRSARILLIR